MSSISTGYVALYADDSDDDDGVDPGGKLLTFLIIYLLGGVGHCFAWQGTHPTGGAGGFSVSTYNILE